MRYALTRTQFFKIYERVSTEPLNTTTMLKPGISFPWKEMRITFSSGKIALRYQYQKPSRSWFLLLTTRLNVL